MEKHTAIANFQGDPNVGLYGLATDKFCLLGRSVREKDVKEIEEALKVPVFQLSLYGTDLIGLFAIGNSNTILIPNIIYESELKRLKKELGKLGVKVAVLETNHTAFGNNIILNDKKGIISNVYSNNEVEKISKCFPDVKFERIDLSIPGSVGKITNKGGIFEPNLPEHIVYEIEKLFNFEIGLGTVNMGNPFISSGIIANSFGFVMGANSSGFEVTRVDESLGFLN
ncbi:MAG: translation initiation factor IF-6 [DPANN group archaeon]|nr:translation initiation factor IF-6 [DPANN group archaeon]